MLTFKRSLKWFLVAVFTFSLLATAASAQECEYYDLYGAVTNEAGKAVKGARVELLDVRTKELINLNPGAKAVPRIMSGSDGRYTFSILGLPNIQNGHDFLLRVSKSGFIAHEEKINIYHCGFKRDIKLMKSKQSGKKKQQ